MIEIDYSPYDEVTGDIIPKKIFELIQKKDPYFDELEYAKFKIRNVESPFILPDNCFDLSEANNKTIEIGVKSIKTVQFTGGSLYTEYVKDGDGIIVQGTEEEGYNIFILQ